MLTGLLRRLGAGLLGVRDEGEGCGGAMEALEGRVLLAAAVVPIGVLGAGGWLSHEVSPQQAIAVKAGSGVNRGDRVVRIPDPSLLSAIRQALGKRGGEVTQAEMLSLRELTANHVHEYAHAIRDVTGLQYARNLVHLNLNFNLISDVRPLGGLTNLQSLRLYENKIGDISSLAGLTRLTALDLGLNRVGDITALSGMTKMRSLNLHANRIADVSALRGMTRLEKLNLRSNQLSDVSALGGLASLRSLRLAANRISDIKALGQLTHLGDLDLRRNVLDMGAGSGAMSVIKSLEERGVQVWYEPQRNVSGRRS